MGLRDALGKRDDLQQRQAEAPQFVLLRSDTTTQEVIHDAGAVRPPPDHGYLMAAAADDDADADKQHKLSRRSLDVFRPRSRSRSGSSDAGSSPGRPRSLSQRLHLSRQRSSEYVPQNLPDIPALGQMPGGAEGAADESQWEKRATMLADQNQLRSRSNSRPPSPQYPSSPRFGQQQQPQPQGTQAVSSKDIDADIQEAIRLHEEGDLERSTALFGRLADPEGADNPLSQVLYGLALRHGWGCQPSPEKAVRYLTAAASNAASVEQLALQAGLKKGGAAKGELVLAIFELANCFRNGWGIDKDPIAAKQYYETAANLGDTDAMNEVAWCYLEGYGCKKDKQASARYYRLAEKNGNKTLGNSWIWKPKYDPPGEQDDKKKKK